MIWAGAVTSTAGWMRARSTEEGVMDIEKILAGLVRVGTVTDVDNRNHMARVKFQGEGFTSASGVKQFIFMSSAIVYGNSAPIGSMKLITKDTAPAPADFYGDSKLQAEKGILPLADGSFRIVILRPPMIYGKNSKGNYPTLSAITQKLPVFPKVNNCRSMLYIGNLVEFVRLIIQNEECGFFFPQNAEYSNTSELVNYIAEAHGKKIVLVDKTAWALKLVSHATGLVNKAFGSMAYEMSMSEYRENYRLFSLAESIRLTEE